MSPFRRSVPFVLSVLAGAALAGLAPCAPAAPAAATAAPVTAATGADGVQRIDMVMESYSFSPARLIVRLGKPVEITLSNAATMVPHNFTLDDPASGLSIHQDVGAGKNAVVRFTPDRAGTFSYYCDKKLPFFPSHRSKGMEGSLEVR